MADNTTPLPGQSAATGFTGFQNFNVPGLNFPFQNLPAQASAAFAPMQFSNGSQYGRWNGVNNNAFGLFPNQFQPLFGYQPQGGGMQFQPPYANMNGGSNATPMQGGQVQPMGGLLGASQGITQSGGQQQAPSIPTNVTPNNTAFSSNFMPTGANQTSAAVLHGLETGRIKGPYAQQMANLPQSFTPAQFNQVAQQNPVLAQAMAAQGGQKFEDAIMQQNGWSPQQMNAFANTYGSGAMPGFNAQAMQLLNSLGIR